MRSYCEETGQLPTPRGMLISSYFAVKTLLATPLLKWYLKMGLVVTRVYLMLQYQNQQCFLQVTTDVANKRRAADKDPSQKLAGESAKLLANSIYGKCLFRVIPVYREHGAINTYEPMHLDWLPVRWTEFRTARVIITDSFGKRVPFE